MTDEVQKLSGYPAWTRSPEECLEHFSVNISKGLNEEEVKRKRDLFGWNELQKEPGKPMWKLILEQFNDTLVRILLGAAVVSFILAYMDGQVSQKHKKYMYIESIMECNPESWCFIFNSRKVAKLE